MTTETKIQTLAMPTTITSTSSDALLIQGCREQNSLAQKYLYERYFSRLMSIAQRYARDRQEAVQIVNQSFMQIFQSLDRYTDEGKLLAWMRTICFRMALMNVRDRVSFDNIEDFEFQNTPLSNEALLELDVDYILLAMRQLPDATRTVFSLYEIDGYNHSEIAQLLTISEGTSRWHLSEAKKQLRLILEQKNPILI